MGAYAKSNHGGSSSTKLQRSILSRAALGKSPKIAEHCEMQRRHQWRQSCNLSISQGIEISLLFPGPTEAGSTATVAATVTATATPRSRPTGCPKSGKWQGITSSSSKKIGSTGNGCWARRAASSRWCCRSRTAARPPTPSSPGRRRSASSSSSPSLSETFCERQKKTFSSSGMKVWNEFKQKKR